MHTSFPRLVAMSAALVLVACASETGPQWTYAPADAAGGEGGETAAPAATAAPGQTSAPTKTGAPVVTAVPASEAPASQAPAESSPPMQSTPPTASEAPAASAPASPATGDGEPRVIELEATPAIRFEQDGTQIHDIAVTPGETVIFRVTNTAGFSHNFYIGTDDELKVMGGETDTGIPAWSNGVQELEWTVPDDVSGLRFGCTIPGHYFTMQGDFTVAP